MCVFWGVKYTRGVWMAAGSGVGFDTLRCLCILLLCVPTSCMHARMPLDASPCAKRHM